MKAKTAALKLHTQTVSFYLIKYCLGVEPKILNITYAAWSTGEKVNVTDFSLG